MTFSAIIMKSVKFTHWSRVFFVSKPFKSFKTVLEGFLWWKFRSMLFKCHLISQIYKNDLKNRWCRLSFFLVLIFYFVKLAVFFFDMKIRNLIGHSPALDTFWLRLNFPDKNSGKPQFHLFFFDFLHFFRNHHKVITSQVCQSFFRSLGKSPFFIWNLSHFSLLTKGLVPNHNSKSNNKTKNDISNRWNLS